MFLMKTYSHVAQAFLLITMAMVMLLCPVQTTIAGPSSSNLDEKFDAVSIGMSQPEVVALFGEPDETFGGKDTNQSIMTWKEGIRPFTRNYIVILIEDNLVARATHSKGNTKNIDEYLAETFEEIDPIVKYDRVNRKDGYNLRFIFDRLQKEKVFVSKIDEEIIKSFDNIRIGMAQEELLSQLGKPEKQSKHTICWQIDELCQKTKSQFKIFRI